MQTTTANLQDYETANLNLWTQIVKPHIFHINQKVIYPLEREDETLWTTVSFGMNLNRLDYSRSRYNFLDVLAAFGGFMGIWRWIFTTYMAAWNTNALDNFMISKLFKVGQNQSHKSSNYDLERSRYPHIG